VKEGTETADVAVNDGTSQNLTPPTDLNAGPHKFYCAVTCGDYTVNSNEAIVTVSPKPLTVKAKDQTITYGESITEGTGQVDVTGDFVGTDALASVTLTASSENVPGGTITPSAATIKNGETDMSANYAITYEAGALAINKSSPTISFKAGYNPSKVYDGQSIANPMADNLDITGAKFENVQFTWTQGGNAATVKLNITKVDYTGPKTADTAGKFGTTRTYDLTNLLPLGYQLGTITTASSDNIFDGNATIDSTILTYKLADNAEVGKTGTITVPVDSSTNYNAFSLTITVTVTNVLIPDLSVNAISVTYTGNPVPASSITGTATVDGKSVSGQ